MSDNQTKIRRYSMLIGGEFVQSGREFEVFNPVTEDVISLVSEASAEQVDAAVLAAEQAQPAWARLPAIKRALAPRDRQSDSPS
jgi:acyl-CoA reductase-like NAD-dependent aldehyde dehydrogenase